MIHGGMGLGFGGLGGGAAEVSSVAGDWRVAAALARRWEGNCFGWLVGLVFADGLIAVMGLSRWDDDAVLWAL